MGRLFAHSRTAGDVVRSVAHESQHVYDLPCVLYSELGLDLFCPHHLKASRMSGSVHEDVSAHQLAVILVGSHHVGGYSLSSGFGGQGSYDIVGLKSRHLEQRDAVGLYDVFYDGHGQAYGFRRLLALGFVLYVGFVTESGAGGVERHADMCGIFFLQHFLQRVDKSQYGRCVESFGIDARIPDERIVGPVDKGIGIEQEQFVV